MAYYAYYKGQRYKMALKDEGKCLLYWYDEDRIPEGFKALDNPNGEVKGVITISGTEVDCAYKEDIQVNYNGYDFSIRLMKEKKFFLSDFNSEKSKAAGLLMMGSDRGEYVKWVPKNEGAIWFRIKPLPTGYEGKYGVDFLTFRFKKDGYYIGEYYAHYKGHRYKMKPIDDNNYLLYWYDDNIDGFEVMDGLEGNAKAARYVPESEVEHSYREYIMATYNGEDFYIKDVTEDQILIQSIADEESIESSHKMKNEENSERWIPREEGFVWVRREMLQPGWKIR